MSLVISVAGQFQEYKLPKDPLSKKIVHDKNNIDDEYGIDTDSDNQKNKNNKIVNKNANNAYKHTNANTNSKRTVAFASEIMSSPVHTISSKESIRDAQKLMEHYQINHLPVLEDDKILGIISDRDVLQNLNTKANTLLKNICKKDVIATKKYTEIKILASIMIDHEISCLPVINDDNSICGIVTKTDLLKYIIKGSPLDVRV